MYLDFFLENNIIMSLAIITIITIIIIEMKKEKNPFERKLEINVCHCEFGAILFDLLLDRDVSYYLKKLCLKSIL